MERKPTDELLQHLTATRNLDDYLEKNRTFMADSSLCEILEKLLEQKQCTKAEAIKKAEINEIYGYQIFAGKRMPSRDKLICLAVGMGLTFEETQGLLKITGFAPLYPKRARDSIIIFGLQKKMSVPQINSLLYEKENETL